MSDDSEEDHEDTAKRLDEDFAGANKVRGTSKERMKTGITGAMGAQGFRTQELPGTAWIKEVSASMQERGYDVRHPDRTLSNDVTM